MGGGVHDALRVLGHKGLLGTCALWAIKDNLAPVSYTHLTLPTSQLV